MSQCKDILRHLETHRGITAIVALDRYGCFRLAARISELRAAGYQITTVSKEVINRYGEKKRIAEYRLVKK